MYYLNGIPLENYGIIAGQAARSHYALTGAWDMPARIGKTHHVWADDHSIEPYVLAEEIRFGGRDITFTGYVEGATKNDVLRKCYQLYKDIAAFTDLVTLDGGILGSWQVLVKGEIKIDPVTDGCFKITIPFREPVVDLTGELPVNLPDQEASLQGSYGIDGISFDSLGLLIMSIESQFNRPALKEAKFNTWSTEGFKLTKPGHRELMLKAFIHQPTYEAFKTVLKGLYALFTKPGLRYITNEGDALRDFFVKDGFQITGLKNEDDSFYAYLDIKLTEVSANTDWYLLNSMADQRITTQTRNIIFTK